MGNDPLTDPTSLIAYRLAHGETNVSRCERPRPETTTRRERLRRGAPRSAADPGSPRTLIIALVYVLGFVLAAGLAFALVR